MDFALVMARDAAMQSEANSRSGNRGDAHPFPRLSKLVRLGGQAADRRHRLPDWPVVAIQKISAITMARCPANCNR
jgi:hypothetical protein